ncbi:MAG: hypothetical protein KGJ54_11770 [Betaproteobacteria bacterium]|nr:hypothetical protein [Betaproteobacteria bacterium]
MTTKDLERSTATATAASRVRPLHLEFASDVLNANGRSKTVAWETVVQMLSKPQWLGTQSLSEYRRLTDEFNSGDLDEFDQLENVRALCWRPIKSVDPNGPYNPANLVSVSAIAFDVEHAMELEDVQRCLAGTLAVVHSTYSHCPYDPRWRVVIPLKSPVNGKTWENLMEHYQEVFGGRLGDIYTFKPHHLFRLPACPQDALVHFTSALIEGEVADGLELATKAVLRRAVRGGGRLIPFVTPVAERQDSAGSSPCSPEMRSDPSEELASGSGAPAADVTPPISADAAPKLPEASEESSRASVALHPREQFVALLKELIKHRDYQRVRERLLDLSMQLNMAGEWAPAFRPYPKIPKMRAKHEPWHSTLQRNLQVIDCHWLHSRRFSVYPRDPEFLDLFDGDQPFDMELAETFAAKVWKTQHRVDEALGLTTFQQAQLCALRGNGILQRRQDMFHGSGSGASRVQPTQGRFRRAMGVWCEQNPRMKSQQEAYQALWEARELLGVGAPMSQISQLAAWKLGDGSSPLADKTVRDKLGNLDRRLAGTV